jgi:hypothetical protein
MKRDWQEAVETGDATALRDMLERGADVDARDRYGQTALMLTALQGHVEAARVLVESGADLNHTAKYRLSALMLAAINDRGPIVQLLLDAGADTGITGTGAPGFQGKTALDLAEHLGRESIVRLLRE